MLSYKEAKVFLKGTPAGLDMVGPKTHVMSKFDSSISSRMNQKRKKKLLLLSFIEVYPLELWQEKSKEEDERISKKQWKSSQPKTENIVLVEQDTKIMINLKGSDRTEVKIRVKPVSLFFFLKKNPPPMIVITTKDAEYFTICCNRKIQNCKKNGWIYSTLLSR